MQAISSGPEPRPLVYSNQHEALDAIKAYFKEHFSDHHTEVARVFCKRSCNECYGRGLRTWTKKGPSQGPGSEAELGYCFCVRKRLHQKADELVRTRRLYAGGGT